MLSDRSLSSYRKKTTNRRNAKQPIARAKQRLGGKTYACEELEKRMLLAVIPTTVQPTWQEAGPSRITGNIGNVMGISTSTAIGAVQAIAVDPTNANTVYIGSANGGIWKTTNFDQASPHWTALTDQSDVLSITSLRFDPLDPNHNTLYAGIGVKSNSHVGGDPRGVFRITNGGAQVQRPIGFGNRLVGHSVNSVLPTAFTFPNGTPPNGANGVVLAAADDGVYLSKSGGLQFTRLPAFPTNVAVCDLIPDPSNPQSFFAAVVTEGIYRGTYNPANATVTWTAVNTGINFSRTSSSVWIRLAGQHYAGQDVLYAGFIEKQAEEVISGSGGGPKAVVTNIKPRLTALYVSTNLGGNWIQLATPGSVEVVPPKAERTSNRQDDDGDGGVDNSEERDHVLFGINPGGQGVNNFTLAADPTNPQVFYVAGDRQAVTNNAAGGDGFNARIFQMDRTRDTLGSANRGVQLIGTSANKTSPHPDGRAFAFFNGNLVESDDGGVYLLDNLATPATRAWKSRNGDLGVTEVVSAAYDSLNDVLLAGTQDNGSLEEFKGGPQVNWRSVLGGDGNTQEATIEGSTVWRYSMGNNFGSFQRRQFNASNQPVGSAQRVLLARNVLLDTGLNKADHDFDGYAHIPYVINAIDPKRMALGYHGLYVATDRGDRITQEVGLPVGQTNDRPVTAIAYGGRRNGQANEHVLYAARGNSIYVREGDTARFDRGTPIGASAITDIVLDPEDWQIAYVTDATAVWVTTDAGRNWTEITGSMLTYRYNHDITSVELVKFPAGGDPAAQPAQDVLLVGTRNGVYRALNPVHAPGSEFFGLPAENLAWTQFGPSLPDVPVSDLRYYPAIRLNNQTRGDVLVAGTLGRGVWTVRGAAGLLRRDSVLVLTGDNQDNHISIIPNATNTANIDVLEGSATIGSYDRSTIGKIEVLGMDGNDTLKVDSRINVVGVVSYDGGNGNNKLTVAGLDGDTLADEEAKTPASGLVVVTNEDGVLRVDYQKVATFEKIGLLAPTPEERGAWLGGGLRALVNSSGLLGKKLAAKTLPLLGEGTSVIGGKVPTPTAESTPGPDADAEESDAGGSGSGGIADFLARLFEEDEGGFDLGSLGTSILDPNAIQQLFDGLDDTPGNVSYTQDGTQTLYDIRFTKTLDSMSDLDLSLLGGSFTLKGDAQVSADIDVHLRLGVDDHGFFIDVSGGDADPILTVSHFSISGDVAVEGLFGLLSLGLTDTSLISDPHVKLTVALHEPADSLGLPPDGRVRLYELGPQFFDIADVELTGNPNHSAANPDLSFHTDFAVGLGATTLTFPGIGLSWVDITNPLSVQIDGIDGLTDLVREIKSTMVSGLGAVSDFAQNLNQTSPMSEPIDLLEGRSIGDTLQIGSMLDQHLVNPIQDYLDQHFRVDNEGTLLELPTLDGLIDALKEKNVPGGDLTMTFSPGITVGLEGDQFLVHFPFHAERSLPLDLDLGMGVPALSLKSQLEATLRAAFDFDMSLGIDFSKLLNPATAANSFYVGVDQLPTISAQVLDTGGLSLDLSLGDGLLDLGGAVHGTLSTPQGNALMTAAIGLRYNDPNGDGRITFSDLRNGISTLFGITKSAKLGLSIPLNLSVGGLDVSSLLNPAPTFTITTLTDEGLFGEPPNPLPTLPNGASLVAGNRVEIIKPDFSKMLNLSLLLSFLRTPGVFISGLDAGLGLIQDGLNSQAFSDSLPLVGSHLRDGAQVIETFRNGMLAKARVATQDLGNTIIDGLRHGLYELLGPANLNLLVFKHSDNSLEWASDLTPTAADLDKFVKVNLGSSGDSLEFDLHLHQNLAEAVRPGGLATNIGFDLGLPGLALSVNGQVHLDIGWDLYLGLGFNTTDHFYLVTKPKDENGNNVGSELKVDVRATTPNLSADGQLGILQVRASDLTSGTTRTSLDGTFAVDIKDPNDDGKLTLAEITSSPALSQIIAPTLTATATVRQHLVARFATPNGDTISGFPELQMDLFMDWPFVNWTPGGTASQRGNAPTIEFKNIKLDLTSFFRDFASPIITQIQKFTSPLAPVLEKFSQPVPVLNDLAHMIDANAPTITLSYLMSLPIFGGFGGAALASFISEINDVNALDLPDDNNLDFGLIDLGSFKLNDARGGSAGSPATIQSSTTPSTTPLDQAISSTSGGTSTSSKARANGFLQKLKNVLSNRYGLKFPFLTDPTRIFQLITSGQLDLSSPVDLFTYTIKPFTASFKYDQSFPIFEPFVTVKIGGSVGVQVGSPVVTTSNPNATETGPGLSFGFDTSGIAKLIHDKPTSPAEIASDLLEGFYISDRANANGTGADVPEFKLLGNLHASLNLGVDLYVASVTAGIEGGVLLVTNLNLRDPNNDGKVRAQEILDNLARGGPLYIFDASGNLSGYVKFFVDAQASGQTFYHKDFQLVRKELLKFSTSPDLSVPDQIVNQPPTATFDSAATTVNEGQTATVSFANQSDDTDPVSSLRYSYDFNGDGDFDDPGEVVDSANPSVQIPLTYHDNTLNKDLPTYYLDDGPGSRRITARIKDTEGAFTTYSTTISINNKAPTANFVNNGSNRVAFTTDSTFQEVPLAGLYGSADNSALTQNGFLDATPPTLRDAGQNDPHYHWISGTDNLGVADRFGFPTLVAATTPGGPPEDTWVNTSRARWITTNFPTTPVTAGDYDLFTSFDLTGFDPSSAELNLQTQRLNSDSADLERYDKVDVYLNGVKLKNVLGTFDTSGDQTDRRRYHVTNGSQAGVSFRPGINVIDFVVHVSSHDFTYGQTQYQNADFLGLYADAYGTAVRTGGSDASRTDAAIGFTYSYDFNNDGDFTDTGDIRNSVQALATVPAGTTTVHGRIQDKDGGYNDYYTTFNSTTQSLQAGDPAVVSEGGSLPLHATSTVSGATAYQWDINGDGNYADAPTTLTPTLDWNALKALGITDGPASYNVRVRAMSGSTVLATSAPITLTVLNTRPTLTLSGPTAVNQGTRYTLSASATDPGADTISSWTIDWGDGQADRIFVDQGQLKRSYAQVDSSGNLVKDSHGQPITLIETLSGSISSFEVGHNYLDEAATYTITASATDEDSAALAQSATSGVIHQTGTNAAAQGYTLTLPSTASGQSVTGWDIDWGDGQSTRATSGSSAVHLYADANTHPVTATPIYRDPSPTFDPSYKSNSVRFRFVHVNAPVVSIDNPPSTGTEGTPIYLTSTVTHPSAADAAAGFSYLWQVTKGTTQFARGTDNYFSFTPDDNGVYTLTLQVKDRYGGTTTTSPRTITVANAAPQAAITGSPSSPIEGDQIQLGSHVTDPGALDEAAGFTYAWQVTRNNSIIASGSGDSFSFSPDDNGQYTIVLQVTDKDGGGVSINKVINVDSAAPSPRISGPSAGQEGSAIDLTGSFTDASPADRLGTFTQQWTVTRGTQSYASGTGSSLRFVPDDNGAYQITYQVTDKDGATGTVARTIQVSNVAPTASIIGAPLTSPEGAPIDLGSTFNDPGALDSVTHGWSVTRNGLPYALSAGAITDAAGFTFVPGDDGTYVVTLAVQDKDGGIGTDEQTIAVFNVAPSVQITGSSGLGFEGEQVSLNSTVDDPAAADDAAPFSYAWHVTKDGQPLTLPAGSDQGPSLAFTPDDNGTYEISLEVTDKDGATGADSTILTVQNVAPDVSMSDTPTSGFEGSALAFTASAIDPSATDGAAGLLFAWNVLKDGTPYTSGAGPAFSFVPDDNGDFTVSVSATDKDGGITATSRIVSVANVAPQITALNLSANPLDEGDLLQVTGTFDDPGAADTHTVTIDWGDGIVIRVPASPAHTLSASHVYADNGTYPVIVTVTDDDGGFDTRGPIPVTVRNVAPVITSFNNSSPGAGGAVEGQQISVAATFNDKGTLDVHTATIDWGDSTSSPASVFEAPFGPPGSQAGADGRASGNHVYRDGGIYTITITLRDDDGAVVSRSSTAVIAGAGLHGGVLEIIGTPGADHVQINQQGNGLLKAHCSFLPAGNFKTFNLADVKSVVAYLFDGDDDLHFAGNVAIPAIVDAGGGNDRIEIGRGPSLVLGDDGNDVLTGGDGRDILIGGRGVDSLDGQGGDDILVGGRSSFDSQGVSLETLQALLSEWTSTRTFAQRVANLRRGTGPFLNAIARIAPGISVFDDDVADLLTGSAGSDWLLAKFSVDVIGQDATDLLESL